MTRRIKLSALVFLCLLAGRSHANSAELDRALSLVRSGDYVRGAEALEAISGREPLNALAWFNLGTARFNAGQLDRAIPAFEKVVALESPLAPAALLSLAKCERRAERLEASRSVLLALERRQDAAPLAALVADERARLADAFGARGLAALGRAEPAAALAALDASLALGASDDVRFARGLALLRLERGDEARGTLEGLDGVGSADFIRKNARYFLDRLAGGSDDSWLSVDVAFGRNTNVYLEGESTTAITTATVAELAVSGAAPLFARDRWSVRASYAGYWDEALSLPAGRFVSQTVRVPFAYRALSWSARVAPYVGHQIYGTSPYLLRGGVSTLFEIITGRNRAGVQYDVYRNFAQSSSYTYLDAVLHSFEAYWGILAGTDSVRFSYSLGLENLSDLQSGSVLLPLRAVAHGPGVRGQIQLAPRWLLSGSTALIFRSYASLAAPDNVQRFDVQSASSARLAYSFARDFSWFASATFLLNRSTLGATSRVSDRNYNQIFALTGVSWNAIP